MQCSLSSEKKTRVTTFKTKPQNRLRFQKHAQGAGVALVGFCIYVSLTLDQELAGLHVTIKSRQMQCIPSTEKKTRVTTFKTNPQSRLHLQKHI
jgi:hypothetical protein